ncbi:MAG TPA: DEAD/DEAH box helicase [Bryobacteraceae bacterium]|nr:DEAD/DEAH box helicase [Bryobacteraceae bacterium]
MNNFSELELCSALRNNLAKHGFVTPTPVQAKAIPPALAGQDVVATAQTGTGKTLGFALPVLQSLVANKPGPGIKAVILSPTRELALQINESFAKLTPGTGIQTAVVVGGMSEGPQLKAIRAGAHVIVATPGRLCDYLQRGLVDLRNTRCIVLDEADRMLDMGFLPSIRAILKTLPETRQTLLFSATIEKSVAHLINSYVRNPVRVAIGAVTRPAEQVNLHYYEVESDRKLDLLNHLLREEQGAFLVFSRTKHGTERLAKNLNRSGVKAARIHGDRTQGQRNQALNGFKDGDYRVLVATDVAARGIHVDNIAHVVNYDLPQAPEDFIHRAGRTGRAGARGTASTFIGKPERSEIRRIERALGVRMTQREVPAGMEATVLREERRESPRVIEMPARQPRRFSGRPGARRRRTATR